MSEGSQDPAPTRIPRVHRLLLGAILTVAVALRVVNYTTLAAGPCLLPHAVSDMAFFAEWSARIADGDLWTDAALHPLHSWHRRVAAEHLARHPERVDGLDIRTLDAKAKDRHYRALWNEWYGGKTFHQEPLYPYGLALTRSVFGADMLWVHLLQMGLGLGVLLLLFVLTNRWFGPTAAVVAAALGALSGPLLFFELQLLRATPIAFATLVCLWLFERVAADPSRRRLVGFGLWVGIATILKVHFAVFGAAALSLIWWWNRGNPREVWPRWGWVALGGLLGGLPVLIRNAVVGAPWFAATSVGPVTFANTNHSAYRGVGWAEDEASLTLLEQILDRSDGRFLATVSATLDTHPSLGSYLDLLWRKFTLVWHWAELPNNVNFYFAQQFSGLLGLLPATFTLIAAAAGIGLVAAIVKRKLPPALLVFLVVAVVQLVAFYSLARLRCALTVALLPLAGWGLSWVVQECRARAFRIVIPTVLVAGLFAWWVQRPLPENGVLLSASPYGNALNNFYRPRWSAAVAAGDWALGHNLMQQAIDARPPYLDGIRPSALPDTYSKWTIAGFYAEIYANESRALDQLGRASESGLAKQRADELTISWRRVDEQLKRQRK